jgi:Arc/MetJ-type ribon-helix-helix transcriptional regulator
MAATKKVTVSLPTELAAGLDAHLHRDGQSANVSAYVAAAVKEKLERDDALSQLRAMWGDIDPDLLAAARTSLTRTAAQDRMTA